MEFFISRQIRSDFSGYSELIDLYNNIKQAKNQDIILDFRNTTWLEANLASIIGAIIELVKEDGKKVTLINLKNSIKNVLQRNGFLFEFGEPVIKDWGNTIISYKKYKPEEDNKFRDYIKNELLSKPDFPEHSEKLGKKINESIFEIYENARTHGKCKRIHSCGQYYPNKTPKRLDMTIVDMGRTIKSNVNEYLKDKKTGCQSIDWAIQYGHTTKTGNISGGLGLDIILQFIKLNKGKVQIVSSDGYWEYRRGKIITNLFNHYFPGTIVNIEFNLDDSSIYKLRGEEDIPWDNIF